VTHAHADTAVLSPMIEHVRALWSRLEGNVGWMDRDGRSDLAGCDPDHWNALEDALAESLRQCAPVQFQAARRSGLAVPILSFGRCVGSVACLVAGRSVDETDALLAVFADQLRGVERQTQDRFELDSMSEQLGQSYEELSLVYKLGGGTNLTDGPKEYFQRFADELLEIIGARTLVALIQPPKQDYSQPFIAGEGLGSEVRTEAVARYVLQLASRTAGPVILTNLSAHPTLVQLTGGTDRSMLAAPLRAGQSVLGVIVAIDRHGRDTFDSADAKLLNSVAEQTAGFLENRFLVQDLNELFIGLLTSLVSTIDAKDPYTCGHSQRVALISRCIAESLGLGINEITEVYLAGLFHDVGKIGVDDAVLAKPGRLTAEEYEKVKEHPVMGARIISGIKQLRNIIPGVLYHHERYDGSGYPEGLKEDAIPMMGAIVALADCLDALTSGRTYRSALSFEAAITELTRPEEKKFSPAILHALLECPANTLERQLQAAQSENRSSQPIPSIGWLQDY